MEQFIVSAVRTPIGKFLGGLSSLTAPQLGAVVVKAALEKAQVGVELVDEVIMGQVLQAGVGQNPARQAALFAGLPTSIAAYTVNKVCGSGLKAAMLASQAIKAQDAGIVVAGGMESMSLAPHLLQKSRTGFKYGDEKLVDALIRDGLWCAFEQWPMGNAAEYIAQKCGVDRTAQDEFSAASHQRAAQAQAAGAFANEIVQVSVGSGSKTTIVAHDEGIRPDSSAENLARLKPAFQADGTVTAGNASQLSDGAAALVIASATAVQAHQLQPLARIVAYATSGVDPKEIFIAPVSAVKMVLERASMTIDQIDLFELNEAFAAQMLACSQQLGLDSAKVNPHGGAIALGHPIGCSGARVLTTLVHALHHHGKRYGLASLCLGGGNAVAMIIERL